MRIFQERAAGKGHQPSGVKHHALRPHRPHLCEFTSVCRSVCRTGARSRYRLACACRSDRSTHATEIRSDVLVPVKWNRT